ncbi:MAG: hypothetical protein ACI8ZN_002126 [Bacteroidia bacterium]|jgi:hypothetical protein
MRNFIQKSKSHFDLFFKLLKIRQKNLKLILPNNHELTTKMNFRKIFGTKKRHPNYSDAALGKLLVCFLQLLHLSFYKVA